jgi:RNA recognition motif-containing protein
MIRNAHLKMNNKPNKVYVDNLAAVTTENDLIDLFSLYGNVAEVNIIVDRVNHKSRGFGFVTMATPEGARAAIQALAGKVVGTQALTVSEAWPNEERTSSSGCVDAPAAVPIILTKPPLKGAS